MYLLWRVVSLRARESDCFRLLTTEPGVFAALSSLSDVLNLSTAAPKSGAGVRNIAL
jgi:hypothetical protein